MNNYYYKNREIILARRAEYYEENKEYIKERNKLYYKEYYERNKQKMIIRANEWLTNLKLTKYDEYRRIINQYRLKYYHTKYKYYPTKKYVYKKKIKETHILKIIEIEPMLNFKFDDEFILDLTEY